MYLCCYLDASGWTGLGCIWRNFSWKKRRARHPRITSKEQTGKRTALWVCFQHMNNVIISGSLALNSLLWKEICCYRGAVLMSTCVLCELMLTSLYIMYKGYSRTARQPWPQRCLWTSGDTGSGWSARSARNTRTVHQGELLKLPWASDLIKMDWI